MIVVRNCTVAEDKEGVEAITTKGSAVKTSSHMVCKCSTTGRKQVKRSISVSEGMSSP